jgi:hypothetical protein
MGLSMNNNGLDIFKKTASLLARNATTLFVLGSLSLLSACGGGGGGGGGSAPSPAVSATSTSSSKPRHQFLHLHQHLHQHQAPL